MKNKSLLQNILQHYQEVHAKKVKIPNDYVSVRNYVLLAELKAELVFLSTLESLEQFKKRCVERLTDKNSLAVSIMPNSDCNQMYFEIAEKVFECNTFRKMLALLNPQACMVLCASFVESQEGNETSSVINTKPFHEVDWLDESVFRCVGVDLLCKIIYCLTSPVLRVFRCMV